MFSLLRKMSASTSQEVDLDDLDAIMEDLGPDDDDAGDRDMDEPGNNEEAMQELIDRCETRTEEDREKSRREEEKIRKIKESMAKGQVEREENEEAVRRRLIPISCLSPPFPTYREAGGGSQGCCGRHSSQGLDPPGQKEDPVCASGTEGLRRGEVPARLQGRRSQRGRGLRVQYNDCGVGERERETERVLIVTLPDTIRDRACSTWASTRRRWTPPSPTLSGSS